MASTDTAGADYLTIVAGLPRSGTSMMMQMLAAGGIPILTDNVRRPDEDNPRGYYELEAVKQKGDTTWLEGSEGKAVKMVYRLLYDLPTDRTYRVVFMCRNLDEVITSQEVMLQRLGKAAAEVERDRLVGIYQRQLNEVKEWLGAQPNFRVLYVDYHESLNDAGRVVEELNAFLDGRLDTEAARTVPDAALYRERQAPQETKSPAG
jgi:hypothetical protein